MKLKICNWSIKLQTVSSQICIPIIAIQSADIVSLERGPLRSTIWCIKNTVYLYLLTSCDNYIAITVQFAETYLKVYNTYSNIQSYCHIIYYWKIIFKVGKK